MKKITIILILLISIFTLSGCFNKTITEIKEDNIEENNKNLIGKEFTRTYNIRHTDVSNDYNYMYITIREFQEEEIETVKVKKELFDNATIGDNYEITFKIISNDIENDIKSIFKNSEIIKAYKTDKTGLEQTQENFDN